MTQESGDSIKQKVEVSEAASEDMAFLQTLRPTHVSRALVAKRDGALVGWMTYFINDAGYTETDDDLKKKRLYIEWWEIREGHRSPEVAASFLVALHRLLVREKIEVVDCYVRDMEPLKPGADKRAWERERAHRANLVQVYTKLLGSAEREDDPPMTMFEATTHQIGELARRGGVASLFSKIP